jgi:hypothetical protein
MATILMAMANTQFWIITARATLHSFTAHGMSCRFSDISTTPAAVTAMADPPWPIATPTSAAASATESLMPSPTINTLWGRAPIDVRTIRKPPALNSRHKKTWLPAWLANMLTLGRSPAGVGSSVLPFSAGTSTFTSTSPTGAAAQHSAGEPTPGT